MQDGRNKFMDNQPPIDPNQTPPPQPDRAQPVYQPRSAPVQPRFPQPQPSAPPVSRPAYGPPPGYQPVALPNQPSQPYTPYPQQQLLPRPVAPGQTPPATPIQPYGPTQNFQPPAPTRPARKRRWPWLVGGVVITAILILVGLSVLHIMQAQPTKAAQVVTDQFISDLQKNDASGAYLLTSQTYQNSHPDAAFRKIVSQVSGGLQGPASVVGRNITKTTPRRAVLVYKVPTQYATQYIKITLEEQDTWQVTDFNASTMNPGTTLSE